MPADQACQLMTVDVSQAIMNTATAMCQASADICMQAFQLMSNEASECLNPRCLKSHQARSLTGDVLMHSLPMF
jgi:hypothetical protein